MFSLIKSILCEIRKATTHFVGDSGTTSAWVGVVNVEVYGVLIASFLMANSQCV